MKNRPFLSRPDALLVSALVLAFLATVGACWYAQSMIAPPPGAALPETAFLSARWGASSEQVASSNGHTLVPLENADSFHAVAPQVLSSGQYKVYQATEVPFLSRKAKVTYAFWQGRLCAFHVFIQDSDDQAVSDDLTGYLERVYGPAYLEVNDGSPLRRIWTLKDSVVNFWFYTDALRMRAQHNAGFGVRYRPISDKIPTP